MVAYDHGIWVSKVTSLNYMAKVQNPDVTYEFSLHEHEQWEKRSNGVDMITCLLLVLRARIFGIHLLVLETVVTFAFMLKFLIGLFMERYPHFTCSS
jgi:hypothetical protein